MKLKKEKQKPKNPCDVRHMEKEIAKRRAKNKARKKANQEKRKRGK